MLGDRDLNLQFAYQLINIMFLVSTFLEGFNSIGAGNKPKKTKKPRRSKACSEKENMSVNLNCCTESSHTSSISAICTFII